MPNMRTAAPRLHPLTAVVWLLVWMALLIGLLVALGPLGFWSSTLAIALTGVVSFFVVVHGLEFWRRRSSH